MKTSGGFHDLRHEDPQAVGVLGNRSKALF